MYQESVIDSLGSVQEVPWSASMAGLGVAVKVSKSLDFLFCVCV